MWTTIQIYHWLWVRVCVCATKSESVESPLRSYQLGWRVVHSPSTNSCDLKAVGWSRSQHAHTHTPVHCINSTSSWHIQHVDLVTASLCNSCGTSLNHGNTKHTSLCLIENFHFNYRKPELNKSDFRKNTSEKLLHALVRCQVMGLNVSLLSLLDVWFSSDAS